MSSPPTPKLTTPLTPADDYFSRPKHQARGDIPAFETAKGDLEKDKDTGGGGQGGGSPPETPLTLKNPSKKHCKSVKSISFSPALEIIEIGNAEVGEEKKAGHGAQLEGRSEAREEGGIGFQGGNKAALEQDGDMDEWTAVLDRVESTDEWETIATFSRLLPFDEDDTTTPTTVDPGLELHPSTLLRPTKPKLTNPRLIIPTSPTPIWPTWESRSTSSLQPALKAHLNLLHPATPPQIISFISNRLISPDRPFGHDGSWRPIWKGSGDLLTAGVGFEAGKGVRQVGPGKEVDERLERMYGVARRSWRLLELEGPGVDKL